MPVTLDEVHNTSYLANATRCTSDDCFDQYIDHFISLNIAPHLLSS